MEVEILVYSLVVGVQFVIGWLKGFARIEASKRDGGAGTEFCKVVGWLSKSGYTYRHIGHSLSSSANRPSPSFRTLVMWVEMHSKQGSESRHDQMKFPTSTKVMSTRSSDDCVISQGLSTDWAFFLFDGGVLSLSLFFFDESFRMFE